VNWLITQRVDRLLTGKSTADTTLDGEEAVLASSFLKICKERDFALRFEFGEPLRQG